MKKALATATPATLFLVGLVLPGTGLLTPASALDLPPRTVPILIFVLAMTVVTELADSAGLFRFVTARMARWGRRSRRERNGRAGASACGCWWPGWPH